MATDVWDQIRQFIAVISERMLPSVFLDPKAWSFLRRMLKTDGRFKLEHLCQGVEVNQREAVTEYVVYPADFDRVRSYLKFLQSSSR